MSVRRLVCQSVIRVSIVFLSDSGVMARKGGKHALPCVFAVPSGCPLVGKAVGFMCPSVSMTTCRCVYPAVGCREGGREGLAPLRIYRYVSPPVGMSVGRYDFRFIWFLVCLPVCPSMGVCAWLSLCMAICQPVPARTRTHALEREGSCNERSRAG